MSEPFDATKIQRPDPSLFRYYVFISLLSGPLAPLVLIPLWCRYATLRYNFDASGVSMCWGVIFRNEVYLTYRRIQDIHLTRNILQRWMGLATISVQTASGSSKAEMTIDGILQPERLRDYIYGQMRGAKNDAAVHRLGEPSTPESGEISSQGSSAPPLPSSAHTADPSEERAIAALEGIRDALQALVLKQAADASHPSDLADGREIQ